MVPGTGGAVSVGHVVDDATLRNLLRLELGFGGEIASIVVAEMAVGGDGQDLSEDGLEIVVSDEGPFALHKLDDTRNKRVPGGIVDEVLALEDGSHGEEG